MTCRDTDVRKPRRAESDKQTVPGGGSKQCATIALLLSVCPRFHVTLQRHKSLLVFLYSRFHPHISRCVCVCQLWHRLVMSDMLKQSRTHIRSNRQPKSATVPKHAVSILSSNFLWSVISQTATHTNTPTGKTRIYKKPLLQPSVWHRCCLCARHLQEYICNLSGGKQC